MYYNREPFKGDRDEGEWKNDKMEGKGIYYFNNGDRQIGDFSGGLPIRKHVLFKNNGDIQAINY